MRLSARLTTRLVAALAASSAIMAGMAACSDDDATTATSDPAISVTDVKAGPASGWSDGGFKPDLSALRCGQTAADPTRGITDTEITVGGLAYLTSPSGSSMTGTDAGAKARFARANDEGGVNGRKINFVGVLDDGNDPARNGSQAKVLVEQQKVFAAVPVMTSGASYLDTFCAQTVPFFGWGFNSGFCNTSIGFGITGCLLPEKDLKATATTYGVMINALFGGDATGKTLALVGNDGDTARTGLASIARQLKSVGLDVVYLETPVPNSGLADATPIVSAIMTANKGAPPDVVLYGTDFTSTLKLTEALGAAGYKGKHLNTVGYDPRLAAANLPGLQGAYTSLQWQPGVDLSVPAVKQMADDLEKYAPGTPLSLPTIAGYWSADLFLAAATKAGRDLNLNTLLKLMNDDFTYYVENAMPESRWPLNHFLSTPCTSVVQMAGDKYDITSDLACGSYTTS
ncbi:ABC transporter substrate-binding protein [Frankia sp. CNm7]|uniref:ABC transporter substrate-binding protein n=1 Tax=Frankia nepalensis TaxID=1836974 RepID=A0A937UL28_9ACTN|nr:ABC transporter substrate-binding protein [Frankia nepalensis]MBL7502292.1 ABC transporter substrate-binding protein [Frankia nepalensis]MBL7515053.1 ABC transporter substrate-binding protein [Frankia nepalensis]MBL7522303.1 ABC transporter substrate-binding protein [Frankia nepalensis]MBL7625603.1 ABC transporter substrate-binding protein [Frankia nepalensis]